MVCAMEWLLGEPLHHITDCLAVRERVDVSPLVSQVSFTTKTDHLNSPTDITGECRVTLCEDASVLKLLENNWLEL